MRNVNLVLLIMTMLAATACGRTRMHYAYAPINEDAADTLVGINYFAGWWPEKPNKWIDARDGHDWRENYPERVPLLGEYNNPETMRREIDAAADYGVDFFSILWYPDDPTRQGVARNLNRGLEDFLTAPNAHRIRFHIDFCNHLPFRVVSDEAWEEATDVFIKAMAHPSYLRVGGRLVFKIWHYQRFFEDCDKDAAKCHARLAAFREKVRRAGLGEMVICAGNKGAVKEGDWAVGALDFLNDYNAIYIDEKIIGGPDQPYMVEADFAARIRAERSQSLIPYMPFLMAGWNPRPWHGKVFYTMPTREEWRSELLRIARDLAANPNMGIPLPGGGRQKAFTIYAWNEFGEGGFVAPNRGEGYMKLECIREVFGVKQP